MSQVRNVPVHLPEEKQRYRRVRIQNNLLTTLTYLILFLFLFPVLWMVLTAFKTESQAFADPPVFFFWPTLQHFQQVLPQYSAFLGHSLVVVTCSTLLAFLLGVPAGFAMALYAGARTKSTLLWMLSTKMMPPVGVIVPLFLIFRDAHLLDTHFGLILMFTTINLPLVVWMVHSYISEIPFGIFEAARADGASVLQELFRVALPLALPGLVSTAFLCMIFSWNEVFFALNLTSSDASPLSVFISSFKTSEGLFWARMSAAATLTLAPVMVFGWFAQRQLVRGLTFGALG
ncbi:carbohydrate ABC transporter permease [Deinococcus roseus]|uniref:Mannitol ABC transporter permease n=1 Tax=Deinococcus roseus TaxID=392414 RepID=A0ABQ2DED2_9DEIO|nr:carbohydrate ABC transporter permease [Deinococcus roseus]GGJ51560.1 mannitol ABC transporter permease [Deinococcus roseus]